MISTLDVIAVATVFIYYLIAWLLFGRDRKLGTIVPLYEPPRKYSPAMLRYVWKKRFDDRTFWAGILSLVAKGLVVVDSEQGMARVRRSGASNHKAVLPREEYILLHDLVGTHRRKGTVVSMLDPKTAFAVANISDVLRRSAVGILFDENRAFVTAGIVLSAIALCIVAGPRYHEQWAVLVLGLAVIAPGAFYLFFVLQRTWDWLRAARGHLDRTALGNISLLFLMIVPCSAAFILGAVVLGVTFGWPFLISTLFLAILNLSFLQWMKAPTLVGKRLLTEIEGFRQFLRSVESLPMQRPDPPTDDAGLYERYLPFAVALEVEQAWGDRFIALTSTFHRNAGMPGAESLYLGMWDGKPIEIVYRPDPARRM